MAIISCPSCNKPTSSLAEICPHCGFQRSEAAEEELAELRRRKFRDRVYHLKMASYAALTLLLAAFAWYMVDTSALQHRATIGPYALFTIGAVLYLLIRILLYRTNAVLKKIRY